jgi:hypothetical protein
MILCLAVTPGGYHKESFVCKGGILKKILKEVSQNNPTLKGVIAI